MIYQMSKDVKFVILHVEGLVLHLKKHTYYHVNETGNFILKALALAAERGGGVSLKTLQQIFEAVFDDPEERSAKDIEAFLKQLQEDGIIESAQKEALLPVKELYPLERPKYISPTIVRTPDEIEPVIEPQLFFVIFKIRVS